MLIRRRDCVRALACGLAVGSAGAAATDAVGTAPRLEMLASDGAPVLGDMPDWRLAYLDFWASWCGPCRQSFPWLNTMHDRHAAGGLRIVGIGLDREIAPAQDFLRQTAPRFAIALDHQAVSARQMAVRAMPTSVLVARDRRILYVHRGFRLDDRVELERRIVAALA